MSGTSQPLVISSDIYEEYTHREHIYKIPDTYIAYDSQTPRKEWILKMPSPDPNPTAEVSTPQLRITREEVTLPIGVERLFIEVLSNAGDNVPRSRRHGVNPGKIEVEMDDQTIVVRSG